MTLYAAREIESLYLKNTSHQTVSISEREDELIPENGVIARAILGKQMQEAANILRKSLPDKVFTIGGGCDADIPSILYLDALYNGDLSVLWFDAHGDINAPSESVSHLLYGMPVRMLLGESEKVFPEIPFHAMNPSQFINLGGRDLDETEKAFMACSEIPVISVDAINQNPAAVLNLLPLKKNVYIHLDLDVLDAETFPSTPLPVSNGLTIDALLSMLSILRENVSIAGMGLFEYCPCGHRLPLIDSLINYGLSF